MITRDGELRIGGIPAATLAERYGTPLYVYDADTIRDRYRQVVDAFGSRYDRFQLHYAVKANSNPTILDLLHSEGAGFDCGSPAEVWAAREIGAAPADILYTGAYNRPDELAAVVEQGVTVNLDARYALDQLPVTPETVSFRVNPGIGQGRHGLVFAGEDAQFGVPEDRVVDAYRAAQEQGADRFGMHMMTGSNNRDPAYFEQVTGKLLAIAGRVRDEVGITFDFIDIGGGLGIPYRPDDTPLDLAETAERVVDTFTDGIAEHDLGEPALRMEPGRYLVGEAGVLLTQVTGVKDGGTPFVGVDTGMHHMIRPMLLDAYHEIVPVDEPSRDATGEKTVVGPICSSTDVLAEDRELPDVAQGDLLGVMNAGAYGFTMASNWNTRPLPAEVLVEDGDHRIVRERQSAPDIFHGTALADREPPRRSRER